MQIKVDEDDIQSYINFLKEPMEEMAFGMRQKDDTDTPTASGKDRQQNYIRNICAEMYANRMYNIDRMKNIN